MSGIAGIIRFDGGRVDLNQIHKMTGAMGHRGPDGINSWWKESVLLGHCLLRTTEESHEENQPLANEDETLVLVLDGYLGNWSKLREDLLGKGVRLRTRADSELVLRAYETWGHDCVKHLEGDFAFAVYDARRREAFCARDRIGMRPFHYYHSDTTGFVFASDAQALLALPAVPCCINEGRIADALVDGLEGIDLCSTFYNDVYRLPPAHILTVTPAGLCIKRYWTFELPSELRLSSDEAYAEAFLDVFTNAVKSRLRGGGTTAAMLSGGLDSGSVVAVARSILANDGQPPLRTFSAVGPEHSACKETRSIYAAAGMTGIEPHFVDYRALGNLTSHLAKLFLNPPTPFDTHMTLPRAVYLAAHLAGARAVLDGVAGDSVLSDGGYLPFLLRRGRFKTAASEAFAARRFWGDDVSPALLLLQSAQTAITPDWARRLRRRFAGSRHIAREALQRSIISPEFAQRVRLLERFELACAQRATEVDPGSATRRASGIFEFHRTAARERYEREAARVGIEPRDPFLDLRVISFCVSLPAQQMLADGWPKIVMRRAMAGRLPEAVRWRRGKQHLGWAFTNAVMDTQRDQLRNAAPGALESVAPYVDIEPMKEPMRRLLEASDTLSVLNKQQLVQIYLLARWLDCQRGR